MDRMAHHAVPHSERTTSSSRIPSNLSPQSATSMIGPSTSYVPPGYNALQAIIYSREHPPANDSNSAYYTAQGSFNAAPYNGHSYEAYSSVPQPQSYSYNRSPQSASPRTGYEGWRDATDSSVPSLPASQNSNIGNANAYHQSIGSQYHFNQPYASNEQTPSQNASPQHHSLNQSSYSDPQAFSTPPRLGAHQTNIPFAAAHDSSPQATSESSYYASPPIGAQPYDGAQMPPVLFSSPTSANRPPLQFQMPSGEPRKIIGTSRLQRTTSLTSRGTNANALADAPATARPAGGSGFSSRSAGPSTMPPPPNPYSNFGGNSSNQATPISGLPNATNQFINTTPSFHSVSTSNPKKRVRHSTSQSLSVPKQTYGHTAQSVPPSSNVGNASGQDALAMMATTANFDDESDDSDDSDDGAQVEVRGNTKANASKGKRKGAPGANGHLARLPGACKNCKRLKMKCVFESDMDTTCKRCRDGGKDCIVEGRKQRQPSNKREQLMNLLREKDKLIDTLLKCVHNPSRLLTQSFRASSPSPSQNASSNPASAGKNGVPPPQSSTTSTKDIYAWLATSSTQGKSPHKSDPGLTLEGSSDEEEAVGRTGVIDIDAREPSLPLSDGFDSVSQRGGRTKEEGADLVSSSSSGAQQLLQSSEGRDRRPSSGELPKMHAVPVETAPFGLFAELSLDSQTAEEREQEREKQRKKLASISTTSLTSSFEEKPNGAPGSEAEGGAPASIPPVADPLEDEALGHANKNYWRPGPAQNLAFRRVLNERNPPELLASRLINLGDVDKLFKIFFDRLNVFLSILDPVIHTPADIFGRCPFLFTVICAVSSRYYTEKPNLYKPAMHFAKVAAAMALVEGAKSVEICQAYIIMSVYPIPARRWEEDRSWLYLRLAIGMATDLALHVPSSTTKFLDERHEREILNRTRTWIICFNLDRSGATQFGKPPSIKEDTIIRHSAQWYKKSPHNHCYDVHMVAYTSLLRLVGAFLEEVYSDPDSPTGLNKNLDFEPITRKYDTQLTAFREETAVRFTRESDMNDPACRYRNELLPFLVNYSRLVMFSFGFQQAFQRGTLDRGNMFLSGCLDSAFSVLRIVTEVLAPSKYLKFAADGHFVFAAFASAFLLKLLRPQFVSLLDPDHQSRILAAINRLIKTLASPEVAVDENHTPKLYSRFLEGLLMKRNQEISEMERNSGPEILQTAQPPRQTGRPTPSLNTAVAPMVPPDPRLQSPTIKVQAPDEEMHTADGAQSLMGAVQADHQMLGGSGLYGTDDNNYAYSTTASSTVDGPARDTATQYSAEDVLMQDDEQWIATMGAVDNMGFWSNMMLPGFQWPSPPHAAWQAPISSEMNLNAPNQPVEQMFSMGSTARSNQ